MRSLAKWTPALIALLAVVLVAASIVSSDPRLCSRCHTRQASSLSSSAHRSVPCYGCHLADGSWSLPQAKSAEFLLMYPAYLMGRRTPSSVTHVSRAACARCHAKAIAAATGDGRIRIVHARCAPPPAKCDGCHGRIAHGGDAGNAWPATFSMAGCIRCHQTREASLDCAACHAGKRGQALRAALEGSGTPLPSPHPAAWTIRHGLEDLGTCRVCHEPTYCAKCHGTPLPHPASFQTTHGSEARSKKNVCAACHDLESFCRPCHAGMEMPHPAGFLSRHPRLAKTDADPTCLHCHLASDCKACHDGHVHPSRTDGRFRGPLPTRKTRS